MSGLHNEFRKLSATISTYYTASNTVSRASLVVKKRHFGDQFGNVRKLELAQEQGPASPEGGSDLNRGGSAAFPEAPRGRADHPGLLLKGQEEQVTGRLCQSPHQKRRHLLRPDHSLGANHLGSNAELV